MLEILLNKLFHSERFQLIVEVDGEDIDFLIEVKGEKITAKIHEDQVLPDNFDSKEFSEFLKDFMENHYESQIVLAA